MKKRTVAKVMAVLMFTSGVFAGVGGGVQPMPLNRILRQVNRRI